MPDVSFVNLFVVAWWPPRAAAARLRATAAAAVGRAGDRRRHRARPVRARLGRGRPAGAGPGPDRAGVPAVPGRAGDRRTTAARAGCCALRGARLPGHAGARRPDRVGLRTRSAGSAARCWSAIALSATSLGLVVPVLKDAGQAESEVGPDRHRRGDRRRLRGDRAAVAVLLRLGRQHGQPARAARRCSPGWSPSPARGRLAPAAPCAWATVLRPAAGHHRGDPGRGSPSCCWWRSPRWPSGSAWRRILGAFLAGAVVGLVDRDSTQPPALPDQARGDRLRLPDPGVLRQQRRPAGPAAGCSTSPSALLRVPVFLLALLVMRGVPAAAATSATLGPPVRRRGRAAAGDVAAVHRGGVRSAWSSDRISAGDRRGDGLRRAAVGADLPAGRRSACSGRRRRRWRSPSPGPGTCHQDHDVNPRAPAAWSSVVARQAAPEAPALDGYRRRGPRMRGASSGGDDRAASVAGGAGDPGGGPGAWARSAERWWRRF